VLISHDRAFLNALSRAMLWVDRGQARRLDQSFAAFEDWRDKTWADEDEARHKLDRKIKHEAKWAVEGISARRKRNMGRVRALQALKSERASQIRRQGTAALALDAGPQSGKLVAEADRITKSFDGVAIVKDFSLKVLRGDRVALVGPNGAGKTTVLKLLTGAMAPDSGLVRLGTNLDMAVFDQARAQLNPDASLWENLTGDPTMRVSGQADQVMVRGQPKHVVGYLKDFLFDEQQARAPVRSLSGGERARLLLARIMARDSNLLVLDEPTNDLDVETLDLLQDLLGEYPGTVLLVSHDRDFIDRVATTTLVFEGQGRVTAYAGGWTDMLAQRGAGVPAKPGTKPAAAAAPLAKPAPRAEPAPKPSGLSFTEKKRLDSLPSEIARLEAEIAKLSDLLSDADLYTREPVKAAKAADMLEQRQTALSRAEEEWLDLAERDQG
ncbi:MAG: ATP-binding cassette domain-containing protein, partial [Rhodobacteraceae bacterium]|nr:ATP-binding cassette domain-containing protein [Paracoccaceae bacterium]